MSKLYAFAPIPHGRVFGTIAEAAEVFGLSRLRVAERLRLGWGERALGLEP